MPWPVYNLFIFCHGIAMCINVWIYQIIKHKSSCDGHRMAENVQSGTTQIDIQSLDIARYSGTLANKICTLLLTNNPVYSYAQTCTLC